MARFFSTTKNEVEKRKHGFGAREMEHSSTFHNIYWPSGLISRYHIKRIWSIQNLRV